MRSFAAALVALAGTAVVTAQEYNESAPFTLKVSSRNATLNGKALFACHEGAAIEGLCVSGLPSTSSPAGTAFPASQFTFNTSSFAVPSTSSGGEQGVLVYTLRGSNFNESEPMALISNPTSNVALPLFSPSTGATQVAFDADGKLNIQYYVDDSVVPAVTNSTVAYYRWYSCLTYYSGYTYQTLNWVYGKGRPQNPSCVKVDVVRTFV